MTTKQERIAAIFYPAHPEPKPYSFTVRQTYFDGSQLWWTVEGCATKEDAYRDAWLKAIRGGWTPPRWWEFWRYNDLLQP